MILRDLMEKSAIEVILEIPKFSWKLKNSLEEVKIERLFFSAYKSKSSPSTREQDIFDFIKTSELSLDSLEKKGVTKFEGGYAKGLISKVEINSRYNESAHIPMMDLDVSNCQKELSEEKWISVIKKEIQEKTKIQRGLLLKTSDKNYHFLGLGDLLSEQDFVTFCGLCLDINLIINSSKFPLVDSYWIGHCLTPMKKIEGSSPHDYNLRFATLRISPNQNSNIPRVIEVLE